jgi:trans-L-3-hydroxyproline dehydratase
MVFEALARTSHWNPPAQWQRINAIDAHTGGEPFRVIMSGFPDLPGETMLARRRYAKEHFDRLRTALMWEPRGHADMYGCIVTPPVTQGADAGVLFIHNEGFSTMCGHGIIAFTTVALETGIFQMVEPETTLRIDTPAGLVTSHARIREGRVAGVYFHNVPSFVVELDAWVETPELRWVKYDLAFGGAFYAYVDAASVNLSLEPSDYHALIEAGTAIKRAVIAERAIAHPFEAELSFLYGVIFTGPPAHPARHSRNVCVFAEGEVDRSPTGTGVSGRLAIHHARGEIEPGQSIVIESLIGSCFRGQVAELTTFGPFPAIIPEVEGTAHLTGRHEFLIDPLDELQTGFLLR